MNRLREITQKMAFLGDGEYVKGEPYQDVNNNGKKDKEELYVDLGEMWFEGSEKVGTASNYDRLSRKSFEPLEGEYIKLYSL